MSPSVRHFLSLRDLSPSELSGLLESASRAKLGRDGTDRPLAGKTLGMIFNKHSTRTRVSFEVGMFQLGGHAVFLSDRDSQMGRGETVPDTARVLSRYVDAIMIRTFAHAEAEELAAHASVPVINGLTDLLHPCQLLADLLTVREEFGAALDSLTVAWIGDGNNVANSWLNAAALLGFELRLAVPEGYDPDPGTLERASREGKVRLVRDPREAVEGAHVVTTDTWASMGQEAESETRSEAFRNYCVDAALLGRARSEAIFLHCLPAYRGKEVTAEVLDGPRSRVLGEAENRLHAQKALLLFLLRRPKG
ncbi:MAG: ornithine carbamoyltransferase [Gemmatimonadetes bacterium]|nr:ornithine carbamoyltransferase [Gemmatimonadota bacterium]